MVRIKPPKLPKPDPPPDDYVIFISTDNGFDIDKAEPADYIEDTKSKRKKEKKKDK